MRFAIIALQNRFDTGVRIEDYTADAGIGNRSFEAVFLQGGAADVKFPHDFAAVVIPFAAQSGPASGFRLPEFFGCCGQGGSQCFVLRCLFAYG